jgi:hypothetical protein
MRRLLLTTAAITLVTQGCTIALAQPEVEAAGDRAAARGAALAVYEARATAAAPRADDVEADREPACPEGTHAWQRATHISLCAPVCTSDAGCDSGERCVILDDPSGDVKLADRGDLLMAAPSSSLSFCKGGA